MKYLSTILKSIVAEVVIIFIYIFIINNYIGNVDEKIKADGVGYYDYLPSIFIHHDILRKNSPVQEDSSAYNRIRTIGFYLDYHGFKVNKYACGTAVLQLPFFMYALLTCDLKFDFNDGYQLPFQKSVFYAALFYLFLTIFFLKKTLELFGIKKYIIILMQLLLVLATTVTHYANYDASFSHVYSLFAITGFIYFVRSYFQTRNLNHFLLACLFFGLILILRQINILIILFVPFLAGSTKNLKDGFVYLFRYPIKMMIGIILIVCIFFIQSLLWYLQTGYFLLYSYQDEGFNFLHPEIFKILFSYTKGLFVYTPVLFIALLSIIWLAIKRKYYLIITWLSFFLILTYVLSSWWVWYYGCSYGMRAYIDYYSVFFVLFALMLNEIPIAFKTIIIVISFMTIPLNIIQTYQYKKFILDWTNMNKDKYWKVFLKTDDRYKGILIKKQFNYGEYQLLKEFNIGYVHIPSDTNKVICKIYSSKIPEFQDATLIQILIDNDYIEKDNSKVLVTIDDPGGNHNYSYVWRYFIQFAGNEFGQRQTGFYDFEIKKTDQNEKIISIVMISDTEKILENVRIRFLKHI
jgi:hypothetical protein